MAEYTKLDSQQTKSILARYPLGTLLSTKLLSGGSENTNYRLHTSAGDFVLTLCEQKSLLEAQQLADLLAHLDQNNFTTSKVISNNEGELVTLWEGKPAMIKNHLPGSIHKILSKSLLMSLGQQLAKLLPDDGAAGDRSGCPYARAHLCHALCHHPSGPWRHQRPGHRGH